MEIESERYCLDEPNDAARLAKVFRALSNVHRLRVYGALFSGKVVSCCNRIEPVEDGVAQTDVVKMLGLAQSTISHHLGVLEQAGLVRTERRGAWTCYFADTKLAAEFGALFNGLAGQKCRPGG